VRSLAKRLGESLLGGTVGTRWLARVLVPETLVVAFHNIIPDSEKPRGDRSLHLKLTAFKEILDWLPSCFDVVPLGDILQDSAGYQIRPRVAITFDDAYAGAMQLGIDELSRRRLPATIFVISTMREGQTFWWDALADPREGLRPEIREKALVSASGRENAILTVARDRGWPFRELGGPFVASTWEEVAGAAGLMGIEVAHHSRTHANAAVLSRTELLAELATGRQELERRVPGARPWLAWPYGRSSARARSVAMEMGFDAAFRVDGGPSRRLDVPNPRFRFPRLNVPAGLTLEGFRLRAVGLLRR